MTQINSEKPCPEDVCFEDRGNNFPFVLQCDLEGIMPNVTISLSLPTNGSPLQDILVHPCVTSLDSAILTSSSLDAMDDSAFSGPYKFPFTPPLESFNLCYYTSQVNNLEKVETLQIIHTFRPKENFS